MKHPTPGADCTRGVRRGCTAPPARAAEPAPLPAPAPAWLCVAAGPCFAIPAAAAALCSSSYRCRRCAHRTSCRAAATAEVPPLEPAAMASGAGHTHTHTHQRPLPATTFRGLLNGNTDAIGACGTPYHAKATRPQLVTFRVPSEKAATFRLANVIARQGERQEQNSVTEPVVGTTQLHVCVCV